MLLRSLLAWACLVVLAFSALAQEEIRSFDVQIEVDRGGDILVTETIRVNVEGRDIRRGIFREFPAYELDEETGGRLPIRYKILSVRKDGVREPYEREQYNNAIQIRIGKEDRFLDYREHVYEIRYRVKNQVRYFDTHDELYWNVTGNYWAFSIKEATAIVTFPDEARASNVNVFTGGFGQSGSDADYRLSGAEHTFETTRAFAAGEGLTISIQIAKGVIDPPSWGDTGWLWWARYGSLIALIGSFIGLLAFYYRSFNRIGRDPVKGPVFPQYEPPKGYSPAAAHHIYYRGFRGHQGLVASLMYLAAQGQIRIEVDDKDKKKTTLLRGEESGSSVITSELSSLYSEMFDGRQSVKLGEKYDADFTKAYNGFKESISKAYGRSYFKWNAGYVAVGGVLTVLILVFAILQHSYWTMWHTIAVLGLIGLNGLFMYLMPAPTRRGQDVRTHLEGFRLYMDKAEKLQLNAVKVGSDAPPPMTVERYETFLPYAVALGVERPWTKHFERLIPDEAKAYDPTWTNMSAARFGSMAGMTDNMVSGMSSGVSSAMPQSSSSSGGGGGFSGGGGGGGGGGGW